MTSSIHGIQYNIFINNEFSRTVLCIRPLPEVSLILVSVADIVFTPNAQPSSFLIRAFAELNNKIDETNNTHT